jgi:hypothetical protein
VEKKKRKRLTPELLTTVLPTRLQQHLLPPRMILQELGNVVHPSVDYDPRVVGGDVGGDVFKGVLLLWVTERKGQCWQETGESESRRPAVRSGAFRTPSSAVVKGSADAPLTYYPSL